LIDTVTRKKLDKNTAIQKQIDNINYQKRVIGYANTGSYHGENAASVESARDSRVQGKLTNIRGTLPVNIKGIKHTPVFRYEKDINLKSVTHFFFHARELKPNSVHYKNFKALIDGVQSRKYIAVQYR